MAWVPRHACCSHQALGLGVPEAQDVPLRRRETLPERRRRAQRSPRCWGLWVTDTFFAKTFLCLLVGQRALLFRLRSQSDSCECCSAFPPLPAPPSPEGRSWIFVYPEHACSCNAFMWHSGHHVLYPSFCASHQISLKPMKVLVMRDSCVLGKYGNENTSLHAGGRECCIVWKGPVASDQGSFWNASEMPLLTVL